MMTCLDVHLMILFLAVLATAPPVDTSLSLWGHYFNLCCCVCYWWNRICCSDKKGVYSDREEAEEGGNITAINIKKSRGGWQTDNSITRIRLR